jgi:hypothetical protein
MRQDHLIVSSTSNKVFETRVFENLSKTTFENSPLIYITFVKNRDTAILSLECIGFLLDPELTEKSRTIIRELVGLFYREFYARSEFWQKANEKWKRKTRKWGRDFNECIKEYLEKRATSLGLPPVTSSKETRVFLSAGNVTMFLKMESRLVFDFLKKALCIIECHRETLFKKVI